MLLGGLTCGPGPGGAEPHAYGVAGLTAQPWVGGLGEGSCRPASPGWGSLVGAQLASSSSASSPTTSISGSSLQHSVQALPGSGAAAGGGSVSPATPLQWSPAAAPGPQLPGMLLQLGLAGCRVSIGSGALCTAPGAAAQRHASTGSEQLLGRLHPEQEKIRRTVYVGNISADVSGGEPPGLIMVGAPGDCSNLHRA